MLNERLGIEGRITAQGTEYIDICDIKAGINFTLTPEEIRLINVVYVANNIPTMDYQNS